METRSLEEQNRIFNQRSYAIAVNGPRIAQGQAPVVLYPPLSVREIEDIKTEGISCCIKTMPSFCAVVSPFVTIAGIVLTATSESDESAHSTGIDMIIVSAIPTLISVCCLAKSIFDPTPKAEKERLLP